eukprot:15441203-Alexandrium_andersonii.AAC.1
MRRWYRLLVARVLVSDGQRSARAPSPLSEDALLLLQAAQAEHELRGDDPDATRGYPWRAVAGRAA